MRGGLAIVLALIAAAPVGAQQTWALSDGAFVEARLPAPDNTKTAGPTVARLSHPTDRYDHDVLGGIPPWTVLQVQARNGRGGDAVVQVVLPETLVFEDVAPRLWDVTGDGIPEIVVVESHVAKGARLAVWGYHDTGLVRIAATGFIGMPHRWLAPVGIGDFDGDGRIEMAYVDRPHLARDLVFVRLDGDRLREIARVGGLTAHRIGDTAITSAVRTCGNGVAEVLLPNSAWQRLMAIRLNGARVVVRDVGAMSVAALAQAALRPCD